MTDGIERYLIHLRAKGYMEGTIKWQKNHLGQFLDYLSERDAKLEETTETMILSYLTALTDRGLSPRTRQAHLSALRGFFSFLTLPKNPTAGIRSLRGEVSLPSVLNEEEVQRVLITPSIRTPVGLRDRAILELLYSSGIRRGELVKLNLSDVDLERGLLRIYRGKNQKDRIVPVGEMACRFLEAYLKLVRWWFLEDPMEEAFFLSSKGGSRLSAQSINLVVKRTLRKSGIKKKVSPHTFRHTMATHLLQNNADIRHIQAMLGHASAQTTEVYTHLDIEDLKDVYRRAHPHGKR